MSETHVSKQLSDWYIFRGEKHGGNTSPPVWPVAPPWRNFEDSAGINRGEYYQPGPNEVEAINAAIYLRRPVMITGKPGSGKSSLAYAVANELNLGSVLVWPITTRSTLQQGLYEYDAIARMRDAAITESRAGALEPEQGSSKSTEPVVPTIGQYIRLGPLGTALLGVPGSPNRPRVLLIDEIDKSDIDFPNELLHVFEEGKFEIKELSRLPEAPENEWITVGTSDISSEARIQRGMVRCTTFPLIILTSNDEREFPPAFLRRCLRLRVELPKKERLIEIVNAWLKPDTKHMGAVNDVVETFLRMRDEENKELATDQLMNAIHMLIHGVDTMDDSTLRSLILRSLTDAS